MKLFATPLSHFARKPRLLMDLYGLRYEFIDVGGVTGVEAATYANNPILKVPTLIDGDSWLIESDHIAGYVVQKVDPSDKFNVFTRDLFDLNVRAVVNGAMTEEVKVILARRTGVPTDGVAFFDKALKVVSNAFAWLESNHEHFDASNPKYRELHLICFWDHVTYYELVPLPYEKLGRIVDRLSQNPLVRQTAPQVLKPKAKN